MGVKVFLNVKVLNGYVQRWKYLGWEGGIPFECWENNIKTVTLRVLHICSRLQQNYIFLFWPLSTHNNERKTRLIMKFIMPQLIINYAFLLTTCYVYFV